MFIKRKTVLVLMSGFIFLAALMSCQLSGDSLSDQTSFSAGANVVKHATDANFTQAATGVQGSGTTAYSSSDTDIATIDSSTGEVNILTVGTTTITATNAGDDTYLSATDTYVLTICAVEFITTWKTTTGGESITIPTTGTGYDYTVDWGEGSPEAITDDDSPNHTYSTVGIHIVKISGTFPRIFFDVLGDNDKILSIENWGTIIWKSMYGAFSHCSNLTYNAADAPNLSDFTSMYDMFNGASAFNGDLSSWDVSSVTDMGGMFSEATAFNGDLSSWDVSSVTTMEDMFDEATAFNGDISSWDVSSVTTMSYMFQLASAFTGHDLSVWTTASGCNITNIFLNSGVGNTLPTVP